MGRGLSAANQAAADAGHIREVVLVKLELDTPIYVHSGIGNIVFDGDTYLGVGSLGSVSGGGEDEEVGPSPYHLTLSGITDEHITEALDAGNYGDLITTYKGYRGEDGLLVDDPWVWARGFYETASISSGPITSVIITVQHDLARLEDAAGDRYTDEDQQSKFPGDTFFKFLTDVPNKKLLWGKRVINEGNPNRPGDRLH